MRAEILCVGTELLLGDVINTNAAFLAKELALLGIDCYYQTVVGDNPQRLKDSLALALTRSDIVITSGGLGPTYDDLTKETVAQHFGRKMFLHQPSLDMLVTLFARFGREMTENNVKQAMMPEGAIIFENDRGTANGLAVEQGDQVVLMLPGPPRELTAMFQLQVRPYLQKRANATLVSHNIHFYGVGEAQLEEELHDYMLAHQNPTVAPYAKEGEVLLRVTARGTTVTEAETLIRPVVEELCKKYPKEIYGVDIGSHQQALVEELSQKGKTIATAESCTGGLVSQRITAVPGSSKVFGLGLCTYANEMKTKYLGVSQEVLATHGAVSEETALAMAEGVRLASGADYGLSTTGIAGPDGGTPEKPVGLVYIAISHADGSKVQRLELGRGYGGGRDHIRYSASSYALHLALRTLRPSFTYGD